MDFLDTGRFFRYPNEEPDKADDDALLFLNSASDDEWAKLLAYTQTRRFREGEILVKENEPDDALYFVESGELDVIVTKRGGRGKYQLASLTPGSVFGEQSFLDGEARAATVRGRTDGAIYRLSRESFDVLAAREPKLAVKLLLDIGRVLSLRLRSATRLATGRLSQ